VNFYVNVLKLEGRKKINHFFTQKHILLTLQEI
jgi:hypothetical protein